MLDRARAFAPWMLVFLSCNRSLSSAPVPDDEPAETFAIVEGWAGAPPSGPFGRVLGVAVAPDGRIWVAHTANGEARNDAPISGATLAVLDPSTGKVVEERGSGQFQLPHALAFDDAGRLWVVDADANRIVVLSAKGETVLQIGAE
jgi:DNA-binding beta-propeller fold protein YncE